MEENQVTQLKIGTRGSPLAMLQAEEVRNALMANQPELNVEIVEISTTGDRIQDRTLAAIGGKGLFTKEIEQALLDGTVDIAVHSAKDMLTEFPEGLTLGPMLPREDTRDGFISSNGQTLSDMPRAPTTCRSGRSGTPWAAGGGRRGHSSSRAPRCCWSG